MFFMTIKHPSVRLPLCRLLKDCQWLIQAGLIGQTVLVGYAYVQVHIGSNRVKTFTDKKGTYRISEVK